MSDDGIIDLPEDALEGGELPSVKEPAAEALRILEAILFASDELLTAARLKAILPGNPDGREIGKMVEKINRQLQKERHPFEIVEIGGGYQFKTIAYYHPWVRQIFKEKAAKRLSIQALECLSIIAYRQPLSKAEIEAIRGVISDGAMKTLLEKRLVTITGRSEKAGRPLLYGTTPDFLKYFGLNKIADLPDIQEFEALVRQKMESMPIEALQAVQAESAAAAEAEAKGDAEALIAEPGTVREATIEVAIPKDQPTEGEPTILAEAELFEIKPAAAPREPAPAGDAADETLVEPQLPDEGTAIVLEPHAAHLTKEEPAIVDERKKERESPAFAPDHAEAPVFEALPAAPVEPAAEATMVETAVVKEEDAGRHERERKRKKRAQEKHAEEETDVFHLHELESQADETIVEPAEPAGGRTGDPVVRTTAEGVFEVALPHESPLEETQAHRDEQVRSTDGETVLQAAIQEETKTFTPLPNDKSEKDPEEGGEATFEIKL
jgi:segregation and condensation protein B